MAILECIGGFCRISLDEHGIRMGQVHAEVVDPGIDARLVDIGFTEIHLRMPAGWANGMKTPCCRSRSLATNSRTTV
jgi:hypothetical protein